MSKIEVITNDNEVFGHEEAAAIADPTTGNLVVFDVEKQGDESQIMRSAVLSEYAQGYWAKYDVIEDEETDVEPSPA